MNYQEYYDKEWADSPNDWADRTFGEEVWKASRQDTWDMVFRILPAFVKELEAARGTCEQ